MSMSIQSDVEILSVQAVEYYAQKHHLSEAEVFDFFCKHQVFEKILIQHETLHQLDTTETFQYVEEIIKENHRDFGRGFYCTVLETQAEEWARRLYLRSRQGGRYVYRYLFRQTDDLKIKHFATLDQKWLEFIKENRTKGGIQHAYDVVVGPVADDNTMETVQLYLSGILKAEEAVERLRYNKVNNQVSFHTPLALEHLTLESRKEVS